MIAVIIDGVRHEVAPGTTVAVAMAQVGARFRRSATGEPRAPVCGMGICYECRVTIDGAAHQLACITRCADGMEVRGAG